MHWKRWITALVLAPPLVLLILKGSALVFTIIVAVVTLLSLWEYFRIVYHDHTPEVSGWFSAWTYICTALLLVALHRQHMVALTGILALNIVGAGALSIFRFKINPDAPVVALKAVFGLLYIPLMLSFLVLLRNGSDGPLWVLFLLWVVMWGDTGALYTGTYLGRHKLSPAVSPKKTVEGAIGGLVFNVVSGGLFKLLFFSAMNGITCVAFALAVGVVGQMGDLFESEFKRAAGIKDSSQLLPGHGGLLDRIDALLFAAPIGFLIKEYLLP